MIYAEVLKQKRKKNNLIQKEFKKMNSFFIIRIEKMLKKDKNRILFLKLQNWIDMMELSKKEKIEKKGWEVL